jgi:hypothetical protein
MIALSPIQESSTLLTILPQTGKLYVRVTDSIGGQTLSSKSVRIVNPLLGQAEVEASVNKIGYGLSNLINLSLWA